MLDRSAGVVDLLRRDVKIRVGLVCGKSARKSALTLQDISEKDPYHALHDHTPVRTFLALFASGLHRVAVMSGGVPRILTASTMLEHFVSLGPDQVPSCFSLPVTSQSLSLPLHPLVSLPSTASVLDAMQVMSVQGLSGLGVLSGFGNVRRESSGSSGSSGSTAVGTQVSPLLMQTFSPSLDGGPSSSELGGGSGELVSIVTARDCAILVVPSEGKQVLGMGLGEVVKGMQVVEHAGQDRGEERMPGEASSMTLLTRSPYNHIPYDITSRLSPDSGHIRFQSLSPHTGRCLPSAFPHPFPHNVRVFASLVSLIIITLTLRRANCAPCHECPSRSASYPTFSPL